MSLPKCGPETGFADGSHERSTVWHRCESSASPCSSIVLVKTYVFTCRHIRERSSPPSWQQVPWRLEPPRCFSSKLFSGITAPRNPSAASLRNTGWLAGSGILYDQLRHRISFDLFIQAGQLQRETVGQGHVPIGSTYQYRIIRVALSIISLVGKGAPGHFS